MLLSLRGERGNVIATIIRGSFQGLDEVEWGGQKLEQSSLMIRNAFVYLICAICRGSSGVGLKVSA